MNDDSAILKKLDFFLNQINPDDTVRYLKSKGWYQVKSKKEHIAILKKDGAESSIFEVKIPLSRELGDYVSAMYDVLTKLSSVEKISFTQVYNNVAYFGADIIRLRIESRDTYDGSIPLDQGRSLIDSAKHALLASACDLSEHKPVHRKTYKGKAKEFIDKCRMGQTEAGSFIVSIICPLSNETSEEGANTSLFGESDQVYNSFPRKVTKQFMFAANELISIAQHPLEDGVENLMSGYAFNISSNFIESLINISQSDDSVLEIKAEWSSMAPDVADVPSHILLKREYSPRLKQIADKLKESNSSEKTTFYGRVSTVKADPELSSREKGDVVVNYLFEETANNIKITLDPELYAIACEAHKTGSLVKIRGIVVNRGRFKILQNLEIFEVVPNTEQLF